MKEKLDSLPYRIKLGGNYYSLEIHKYRNHWSIVYGGIFPKIEINYTQIEHAVDAMLKKLKELDLI